MHTGIPDNPYSTPSTEARRSNYRGIGRLPFWLYCLLFPVILLSVYSLVVDLLGGRIHYVADLAFLLLSIALSLFVTAKRLKNAGGNVWYSISALIPFFHLLVLWKCLVRQTGYHDDAKLDSIGWFLSFPVVCLMAFFLLIEIAYLIAILDSLW